MKLNPFLTATGFLAAILLVWASLWQGSYPEPKPYTVYLGLMWTFFAVMLALSAFALAAYSNWRCRNEGYVEGWPLGLFVATLIMTGVDVYQSLVSTTIKLLRGLCLIQPLIKFPFYLFGQEVTLHQATVGGLLVAIGILALSVLGAKRRKCRRALWLAEAICVLVVIPVLFCFLSIR